MSEFGHTAYIGSGFYVDAWGRGPFVIEYDEKVWRFEDSDRFGPSLLTKRNQIRKNPFPPSNSPFWELHRRWVQQGRRVEDDGVKCVVDYQPPEPGVYYP